ncbi:HlyD family type I secretion periplasmic adaptor subunit [Vibrio caribbeanicus]|uniref:HlyD family type I secretion periplasmic adaptor subunit n=1 Tax=Vibrio caribbeanicus TaxID=701175 RepID=UPI003BB63AB4
MRKMLQLLKTKAKGKKTQTKHYDFLPSHLSLSHQPPSPFARLTALSLSIGVIVTLLWAYFGKLDVQATATGKLIVSGRSQVIQAYEQSRVIQIHVRDGQRVQMDDPLLTVDILGVSQDLERLSSEVNFQTQELILYRSLLLEQDIEDDEQFLSISVIHRDQLIESYHIEHQEFLTTLADIQSEMDVNNTSQSAHQSDIEALDQLRNNISLRLKARKALNQARAISRVEYLEQEKELLETDRQLAQQKAQLKVLQSEHHGLKQRMNSFKAQRKGEWLDKKRQARLTLKALKQQLSTAQERQELEIIRSPVNGTVQQLNIFTLGAVLQPAQSLMIIVPENTVQQAEVKILNKDIGFVYSGQKVTLKVDAFSYTRYGTIEAELISVSRDSTADEQLGLIFPALVELKTNNIVIDEEPVTLMPGMSVVAEIKTDKRRIIDYVLSPIREYQAEAMREK